MSNRTALITGAGRGIGAATAVELGRRGLHVIVNYHRDAETAGKVVQAVQDAGGSARPFQADVRTPEGVADMVAACGPVDALVCNANIMPPFAPFEAMPWETFIGKVDGELAAAFHTTRAVLPGMRERRSGRIVYVSSLSAEVVRPGAIAHATAKAALNTFARHIAAEAGPHGITVNVVAPAAVRTEGSAGVRTPELESFLARRSVLGRVVDPEDVASVIASLLDGGFQAVTGTTIPVDAGFRVLAPPGS
jgi:3-oxoacyl-[acyl-carrier protein] reductase